MTPQKIIEKLNKLKVHFTWDHTDGETGSKIMTLEDRLANSCEQGKLVTDKWLKDNMEQISDIWDNDEEIIPTDIYCVSAEAVYHLGSTYKDAKRELDDGYVSQISNTQPLDGEDYWKTTILD